MHTQHNTQSPIAAPLDRSALLASLVVIGSATTPLGTACRACHDTARPYTVTPKRLGLVTYHESAAPAIVRLVSL